MHNIKWLSTAHYDLRSYSISHTAEEWESIISQMFSLCDKSFKHLGEVKLGTFNKESLPIELPSEQWLYEVYRTLGSKVEQLKPFLKPLDGCQASEFDRLSRWGVTHLFFRD